MPKEDQSKNAGAPLLPIGGITDGPTQMSTSVRSSNRTVAALATFSPNSAEETSSSTNSIDDSATQLLTVMKEVKSRDPESVRAICMCAKEIANLARAKIEFIKISKMKPPSDDMF